MAEPTEPIPFSGLLVPDPTKLMVALFGFSALLGAIGIIISLFHHP